MNMIFNANAIARLSNKDYTKVKRVMLAEGSDFRTTLSDQELRNLAGLIMFESIKVSTKIMDKANKGVKVLKPYTVSYKDESGKEYTEEVHAYHIGEAGSIVKAKNFGKVLKSMIINEKQK